MIVDDLGGCQLHNVDTAPTVKFPPFFHQFAIIVASIKTDPICSDQLPACQIISNRQESTNLFWRGGDKSSFKMGCGMSTEEKEGKARNEEIENQLKRDRMQQRNEIKMLLLGMSNHCLLPSIDRLSIWSGLATH